MKHDESIESLFGGGFVFLQCQHLNVQMASSSSICEFISPNDMATTMQLNDISNLQVFLLAVTATILRS